jgi:hypothetical protein
MHGREMIRIMIEGALNGIGFVIGSAVVGWIFLHGSAVLAFAVFVIVLWLIFRNGRHLKTRLERAKIDEFTALSGPQSSMHKASLRKVLIRGRGKAIHGAGKPVIMEPTLKRAPRISDANSAGRLKEPQPYRLLGLAAGKSSCARALSLLSFCPSIRLSRETGLTTRHLS